MEAASHSGFRLGDCSYCDFLFQKTIRTHSAECWLPSTVHGGALVRQLAILSGRDCLQLDAHVPRHNPCVLGGAHSYSSALKIEGSCVVLRSTAHRLTASVCG